MRAVEKNSNASRETYNAAADAAKAFDSVSSNSFFLFCHLFSHYLKLRIFSFPLFTQSSSCFTPSSPSLYSSLSTSFYLSLSLSSLSSLSRVCIRRLL